MTLNDKRLGAYGKILKGNVDGSGVNEPSSGRMTGETAKHAGAAPGTGDEAVERLRRELKKKEMLQGAEEAKTSKASSSSPRPSVELPGLLKVPASGEGGKESSYRKVAKFLLLIGVDEAAKVIAKLTPEQTEKVVLELASIRSVDKDEASVVLAEFDSLLKQAREPSGGVETARTILEAAFGPERAEAMLLKAVPDAHGRPFDYLDDIDPDRLSRLIVDELPAVKALVLSQIKPKLAADVIKLMGEDEKKETVMRLAKLKAINPDVLRRVDDTMREKVLSLSTTTSDSIDGRSALAEILKRMDGASEQSILSNLSDSDPDLGKNLRERLFTVDDIVAADDRFVQETLRPMSEHDLAVLVAGKGENFRNKIFGNMSKTRGALVLEEEKIVSPVTRAESEKVTSLFFSVMRRGWEEGKFYIAGRSDKEVWV
jgi:flagellar motor switch protein FliG